MTTQPPDPADEQPQAGDVPPPDPGQPAAPPPMPSSAGYPPMAPPPASEQPRMAGEDPPMAGGQPPMPPPPAGEYAPTAPPPIAGYGQPAYGAVPAGMYYDQESGLLLPEGTQLATVGRRVGAFFLSIALWIITLGIGYIIWGLIVWANGQTPALQVLGMRCWRPETRQVPGWWWMALREIVGRIIESILGIISDIASLILMIVTRERKALHDWVAGTVVLHDPNKVLSSWPPAP